MTTAVLNYIKSQKARVKIDSISFPHVNWKIVCIFGVAFLAMALVFYAYQISNLTRGYYLINSYEKEITNLSKENKNLQLSFAESSFLAGVLQKAEDLNFQRISSVKYIQIIDSPIAVANKVK